MHLACRLSLFLVDLSILSTLLHSILPPTYFNVSLTYKLKKKPNVAMLVCFPSIVLFFSNFSANSPNFLKSTSSLLFPVIHPPYSSHLVHHPICTSPLPSAFRTAPALVSKTVVFKHLWFPFQLNKYLTLSFRTLLNISNVLSFLSSYLPLFPNPQILFLQPSRSHFYHTNTQSHPSPLRTPPFSLLPHCHACSHRLPSL